MRAPGMFGAGLIAAMVLAWAIFAIEGSKRAHGSTLFPVKYDEQIQASTRKFWPDYPDWKLWKSQLWQESRLDPDARSPVGAQGLAQMMPATWDDISRALGYGMVSRTLAGPAIEGGAYYMAQLRRTWAGRGREVDARNALAEASYNAGTGSVLKAQRKCSDALLWVDIAPCLPFVTGSDFARQTTDYVRMITKWRGMM